MRVISGKYKGINLDGFNIEGTRPTMDRVKESMFAMIQGSIKNSICLDLFAGSGSLGIEALSNGAKYCYFIDNSNDIYRILKANLAKIKDNNYKIIFKNYKQFLKDCVDIKLKFDIIFLDPPYKLNLINDILKYIYENKLLSEDGIIVCEYESEVLSDNNFSLIKHKKYGSKLINIYKW